ncbi:MAG: DNA-directed RNA polymerase subunit L [Candidatus Diapherotrites archaeon]|jgi:DNA-directed RNA polymerase subunit L|uniref:DNA-directed RNA polymerase subunit Rpo11 n=1 Tax=Candidatus Iainarchaeum sp. TaxID=3101447 RepID=A0A8T5GGW8_9ARCH|nr:DNA-directed RNA polymerase subunit L [Candidatus Diapherotrites archaeon]MBT7241764.1 DNA-directed RNA polymerase subunit L [Candidatus Diapherotrites archaeon]
MKLEIIKDEKSELEFVVEGERHTVPNLLREKLSGNNDVEFVAYKLEHPLDQRAVFVLKTKGSAKKVLEDTVKDIQKDIDEFKKGFEKAK